MPPSRNLFLSLILVAKSRNGSSSNDGSSRKERPVRRAPSATGQETSQEGIDLRTHTFHSAMSFVVLFCNRYLLFWRRVMHSMRS